MTGLADEYDFWLFDLDGTLVDAEWAYTREVFDRVGDRLGVEFSDRQAEVLWHGLGGSRDAVLREWGFEPEPFWEAFNDVEDPGFRADATRLHDDAAVVGDLDGPVGLVTHCPEFLGRPVLSHLDMWDWFDVTVFCDYDTGYKPDPAPLEMAMDALGVSPERSRGVYVGDGRSDVGAAWNAGLDSVHVERHDPEIRGHCVLGDHRVRQIDALLGATDDAGTGSRETRPDTATARDPVR